MMVLLLVESAVMFKLIFMIGFFFGMAVVMSAWLAYELLQKHKKDLGGK